MKRFLFSLLFSLSFSISPAFAAEWVKLGSRNVDFKVERDVIQVGAIDGTFKAIKIDVDRAGIEMYDIVVTFGNGETFSPATKINFAKGSLSRSIDLPGEARVIKKVAFLYKSKNKKRGKKAQIHLYGDKVGIGPASPAAEKTPDMAKEHPDYPGWKHVGSRKVSPKGEKDSISVIEDGPIRSFLFAVTGGDVEVFDVVVHFANGKTFSPATRFQFNEATKSRNIDLPGEARRVTKIDFYYKSNSVGTKIHVFGKN